jgi:two-component system response regulator NreC
MSPGTRFADVPDSDVVSSRRPDGPIKVVLADDHRAVRRNLRLLLDRERDVEVIAEAGDLFTAIRHVKGHAPHVLVLDLRILGGPSIEVIKRLRAEAPQTGIVVLTSDESPLFARQAIDAGAVGYVLRESVDTQLPHAVRCAAREQRYISPHMTARLEGLRQATGIDRLSPRETEVLRLIALGFTSLEISGMLHVSRRTVESHRRRIHHKLGLVRRSELVRYALARNLIGAGHDADGGSASVAP